MAKRAIAAFQIQKRNKRLSSCAGCVFVERRRMVMMLVYENGELSDGWYVRGSV
jgi:hypothetical protein